jgi:hypothetical protein
MAVPTAIGGLPNLTLSMIRKRNRAVPADRENFREDRANATKAETRRVL